MWLCNQAEERISIIRKHFRISAGNILALRQCHTGKSNPGWVSCHDILHCHRNLLGCNVSRNIEFIKFDNVYCPFQNLVLSRQNNSGYFKTLCRNLPFLDQEEQAFLFCNSFPIRFFNTMPKMGYSSVCLLSVSLEVYFLKEQLVVHLGCFELD